ncbi:65-kDa microtubule-associated protein 3-like isoform X1 [Primulina huaijiensis]|uniref:65-kDa microtubule-associated protein 3-like isoform X1 n=1 Tax=Primulina huaijiensis TaxID=1492673 RepID=UPI003CC780E8
MGQRNLLSHLETSCGTLLKELQIIWDEVGESASERDRMLLQLEQECMEVYRRKVDQANKDRAQLRLAIADAEAELAAICSAMGEMPVHIRQADQNPRSLKAELRAILPQIEEMQNRKCDRKNQIITALEELHTIKNEISSGGYTFSNTDVDEADLSSRKLEEVHRELKALQEEKSARLNQILDYLNLVYTLCSVLGLDFKQTVSEIHPSLGESEGSKNISDHTLQQLETAIQRLQELKIQRIQQLRDLTTSLLELWKLMDMPVEEQQIVQQVTCNIVAAEEEITEPEMLSVNFIDHVKAEVSRLEELKTRKLKELVLKKKAEIEDIHRKTHLIPETDEAMDTVIEPGAVDAACVLEKIELQMSRAKEEALSRKEILEKVEKWIAACEEESWLEEYSRDDNRYNAGRGAHLTLRRAEKARVLVNKLPAMVDTLASKIVAWENEKGLYFIYDGVRLLSMLERYMVLRQEKELEQKRQRDEKKLQGQLLTEQEVLYGSKPSPMKNPSAKKGSRLSYGGQSNRRLSLGGPMLQTHKPDLPPAKATPNARTAKKNECINLDRFRDDGFAAALSSGGRGLDIVGLPLKLQPFDVSNACGLESPIIRKPFSPISSSDSSNSNATNMLEDLHKKHSEMLQKTLLTTSNNTQFGTPPKILPTTQGENRTPQTMPVPVPSTPSTVSIPMQTGLTPAPTDKSIEEEIEYSFEERRAGFVLPRSLHSTIVT